MCGIAGVLRFDRDTLGAEDAAALSAMAAVQRHRGPDDCGMETHGPCGLASQRLSILDLSPQGHMPMRSADGQLALVHNGEIYNYLELRDELRALGHTFRSEGDTEVILRAYEQWGEACSEHFVGMWAFALWDARKQRLFLSRDRFGIKPLYLHQTPRRLVFASEIKAIVAYLRAAQEPVRACSSSIATYAATGLVDGLEETFFAGVRRFPAAASAGVDRSGVRVTRYWSLAEQAADLRSGLREEPPSSAERRIRERLEEAVRLHLRSDVPVGVCLSGGLDSSAVVALASRHIPRVRTFTVYFDEGPDFDERVHARAVAGRFEAESRERCVQPGELLDTLRRIVWHLDEPSLALGVYPHWHVMELAHHDVKVVLDGQGGDEIFAGYDNYLPQQLYALLPGDVPGFVRDATATARLHGWGRARAAARSAVAMRLRPPRQPTVESSPDARLLAAELRPLADVAFQEWRLWPRVFDDWLTNVLYWEVTRTRLPALLRYEDRLSMAFSIESRVPFLDHRLVELAFALPGSAKVRNGWSKLVLRQALAPLLPAGVVWRRDKKGFPTPVGRWLRDQRGAAARDLLRDPHRRSVRLFPARGVEALLAEHESGRADRSWQLWRVLSVELWLEAFGL